MRFSRPMRCEEPPSRGSPNWSNLSHTSRVHPTAELLPRNRNPNLPTHPPLDPPDPNEATTPPPTPTHHWHRSLVSSPRSTLVPAPQPRLHACSAAPPTTAAGARRRLRSEHLTPRSAAAPSPSDAPPGSTPRRLPPSSRPLVHARDSRLPNSPSSLTRPRRWTSMGRCPSSPLVFPL